MLNHTAQKLEGSAQVYDMVVPKMCIRDSETAVHLKLLVSFAIVIQVVEHGQCIRENNIVHTAVNQVHPLSTKSVCNCVKSLISVRLPVAI